jgi:hypothetical protein
MTVGRFTSTLARHVVAALAVLLVPRMVMGQVTVLRPPFCSEPQVQFVPHGEFEAGLSGWAVVYPEGSFVPVPGVRGTGIQTRTARNTSLCGGYVAEQRVAVTPGAYVLSAYFNTEGITSGNLYIDFADQWWEPGPPSGCGWHRLGMLAPNGIAGWQFVYTSVTIPAGVTSVNLRIVRDGPRSTSDAGIIDEVGLTPIANFIPPRSGTAIVTQPIDQAVDAGTPVTFLVEAASPSECSQPLAYRWQRRNPAIADDGAPDAWIDLEDGNTFLNTRTPILGILRPWPALATGYRCRISGGCPCPETPQSVLYTNTVNFSVVCPADFNADGGIDFGDIEAFFERWENGC